MEISHVIVDILAASNMSSIQKKLHVEHILIFIVWDLSNFGVFFWMDFCLTSFWKLAYGIELKWPSKKLSIALYLLVLQNYSLIS